MNDRFLIIFKICFYFILKYILKNFFLQWSYFTFPNLLRFHFGALPGYFKYIHSIFSRHIIPFSIKSEVESRGK